MHCIARQMSSPKRRQGSAVITQNNTIFIAFLYSKINNNNINVSFIYLFLFLQAACLGFFYYCYS